MIILNGEMMKIMNTTAEVYLWGTRVGIIHQDLDKPYASFEYDSEFLKSWNRNFTDKNAT